MAPVMVDDVDQSNAPAEPTAADEGGRPWAYDRAVTRGFFQGVRPVEGPIVDRRSALSLTTGIAVIVVGSLAYRAPLPVRMAVAVAMIAAYALLIGAFFATYRAAMIRAHLSVVDRPDLGEVRRWLVFGLAVVGYPLALLILLLVGPLALQTIGSS